MPVPARVVPIRHWRKARRVSVWEYTLWSAALLAAAVFTYVALWTGAR